MIQTEVPVVRKQVVVNAPAEQAFRAFTERFGDFKPPEHNLLAAAIAETVFEPHAAGTSTTAPWTAASAGGRGSWPTSHQPAWYSPGTSARNGRSRPTRS